MHSAQPRGAGKDLGLEISVFPSGCRQELQSLVSSDRPVLLCSVPPDTALVKAADTIC